MTAFACILKTWHWYDILSKTNVQDNELRKIHGSLSIATGSTSVRYESNSATAVSKTLDRVVNFNTALCFGNLNALRWSLEDRVRVCVEATHFVHSLFMLASTFNYVVACESGAWLNRKSKTG